MMPKPKDRLDNLQINLEEFTSGATQLRSLPTVLFVELTQNCNLNCIMCRSAQGYQKELNMADDIFDMLQEQLFPYASIVDLRGYGESTILKNFEERVTQTALLVPKIRLVTNALTIKRELWELLMEKGSNVIVSVDSSSKETMNKLGRGSFDKLLASLAIGSIERDKSKNGSISFNTVISSLNLEELQDIVLLAKEFGIKRVTMFPVVAKKGNPLNLENRKLDIVDCFAKAEEVAIHSGIELRLGASLDDSLVIDEGLPNRCSHPWEYCYIDYMGNVGYCDHLIGHTALMFGNLRENTFDQIWNGTKFQELREMHSKARRGGTAEMAAAFPHCNWCYKRRYVDFEDETNSESKNRIISTSNCNSLTNSQDCNKTSTVFLSGKKLPYIITK